MLAVGASGVDVKSSFARSEELRSLDAVMLPTLLARCVALQR